MRCDQAPAWAALQDHFITVGSRLDLRDAFRLEEGRFEAFTQQAPHVFADLSKNLIDAQAQALLLELARECALERHRDAMFGGEPINNTEKRAVKHWLLRVPRGASADPDLAQVHETLDAMLAFAEKVRADAAITDVVNIGIGGSDLGPQMAVSALESSAIEGKRFHFVSNVDGHELASVLRKVRPESTLFLVASKTFTTIETMTNARSARAWFEAQGGNGHRAPLRGADDQRGRGARVRHHDHLRLLGLGGRALFDVVGDRAAHRHRHRRGGFPRAAGRRTRDGPALRHGAARAEPAGAPGPARRLVPQFPRLRQPQHRAVSQRVAPAAGVPAAAGNGKQRQARGRAGPRAVVRFVARACGASRAPTASMRISRCCTRAPRWCRWSSSRCDSPPTTCPATTPCCWPMRWHRRRR